jgi:DNA (cytosine-5)-methyltransferase 1
VTDVRVIEHLPPDTELVAAGFPCQDLSQAGATKGIRGKQSGLVDEVFRLLDRQRVPWLLLENVPFMLHLGGGAGIDWLVTNLERLGYRWAYRVVDGICFGTPQRRQRVYMLAAREHDPAALLLADSVPESPAEDHRGRACGFYWTEGLRGLGWAIDAVPTLKGGSTIGIPSPPAIWFPDGRIMTPDIRDAERLQGFAPDWTLPACDVARPSHRWKLVGNAVNVLAAEWLGYRLSGDPEGPIPEGRPLPAGGPWPKAARGGEGGRFAVEASL